LKAVSPITLEKAAAQIVLQKRFELTLSSREFSYILIDYEGIHGVILQSGLLQQSLG